MADSKVTNKLRTKESSEVKFSDDELQSLAGIQTSYQEKSAVLGQLKVQRILADQQMEALEDTELFEFSTQHFDEDSHRIEKGD